MLFSNLKITVIPIPLAVDRTYPLTTSSSRTTNPHTLIVRTAKYPLGIECKHAGDDLPTEQMVSDLAARHFQSRMDWTSALWPA
jgi:hypothetical protein